MSTLGKPDDPRSWMARARSNLLLAELGKRDGVYLEDLTFEAQQAVEKAIKDVYVFLKIEFPKTHSLITLFDLIEYAGVVIPSDVREADILTIYAVQSRYPDWDESVTDAEYRSALNIAKRVIEWADNIITSKN
jgi:HEPN domain-containing protein